MKSAAEHLSMAQKCGHWGAVYFEDGSPLESELSTSEAGVFLQDIAHGLFESISPDGSGHLTVDEQSSSGTYPSPVVCVYNAEGLFVDAFSLSTLEREALHSLCSNPSLNLQDAELAVARPSSSGPSLAAW